MAEQPAPDAQGALAPVSDHGEGSDEIESDVIVVASIERDALGGIRLDHAAHNVEGAVAIERRDLDGDDVLDRGEAPPERHRQHEAADGGLQVEADDRDLGATACACASSSSSLAPLSAASESSPA